MDTNLLITIAIFSVGEPMSWTSVLADNTFFLFRDTNRSMTSLSLHLWCLLSRLFNVLGQVSVRGHFVNLLLLFIVEQDAQRSAHSHELYMM